MTLSRLPFSGMEYRNRFIQLFSRLQHKLLTIALQGILLSLLVSITVPLLHAAAVEMAAAPPAADEIHTFNVPAGPLDAALDHFAHTAGVNLYYDAALLSGLQSKGLSGNYSIASALSRLLAGSGIKAVSQPGGGYSLRKVPTAGNSSSEAVVLPLMTVSATIASADGSADQGYRSEKVSQVGPWQGRVLQNLPYAITVIPEELIDNLQAITPDQVFRIAPTTHLSRVQAENDQPNVSMRGFRVNSSYRDGVPGAQLNHATTTEDTERIEILNGLSGFLYGSGNVGGVINYVSKQPTFERLNRITIGNNGGKSYYAHGDFGGPIDSKGRFSYRINAIAQGGETALENHKISKTFVSGVFDWRVFDGALIQLMAAHRNYENEGALTAWTLATGVTRPSARDIDNNISWGQQWASHYYRNNRYGINARWEVNDVVTLRATWHENRGIRGGELTFNSVQADGTITQFIQDVYAPDVSRLRSKDNGSAGFAFADFSFNTGSITHKLTTGVRYFKEENLQPQFRSSNTTMYSGRLFEDGPLYLPKPDIAPMDRGPVIPFYGNNYGRSVIIGDDITFNPRWSLLVGLAHTQIESKATVIYPTRAYSESALTPTVSLIYKPISALTTYASYMESLESGGGAANEFNGVPVVNAGETMAPLVSRQYEIGAKWSIGGMLLTTALFQIDKGLQYYDLTAPTEPRYVQDGRQVHRGIEFSAFGKVTNYLTLIGGFTWFDTEVTKQKQMPALKGKRPMQVPEKVVKLRAEYRLPPLPALTLIGGVNYTGDSYGDAMNTDHLPGYTLLDAGLRYEMETAGKPLTLRLDVNNLTNKRYWVNAGYLGAPRTVLFSASLRF